MTNLLPTLSIIDTNIHLFSQLMYNYFPPILAPEKMKYLKTQYRYLIKKIKKNHTFFFLFFFLTFC